MKDRLKGAWERVDKALRNPARPLMVGRYAIAIVVFYLVVKFWFGLSSSSIVQGVALGSLYGVIGVGLILIYRTNRIINFAAAAVGAVPAILALLLDVQRHINYLVVLPIALIGGPLAGAFVDVFVIRWFSKSPRLILTVVTIGVAQSLAIFGFFIPVWLGARAGQISHVPTPWQGVSINDARGQPLLTGNQVAALVTVIVLSALLAAFLRYTRVGVALRASAENADRASLLGIPVRRVQTVAWMAAGLLAAMAIFVQSPLIGVPNDATLGFDSLLYALAAAVVARMERISVCLMAGMGIGVLVTASVAKYGSNDYASALMLLIILFALLLQRGTIARALDAGTSTWETVKQFRPVPAELRRLPEVVGARTGLVALLGTLAVAAPFLINKPDLPNLQVLPLFGIIAVSLVVLTGWAGQISLGQFGLVGAGALASGGLIANHNIDFFAAMGIGIGAGVLAAVIIGLPAVRIQGLYLAVTTLAFGYFMEGFALKRSHWIGKALLPKGLASTLKRPVLYGRLDLENERTFYFVCLIFLVIAILAAMSFRRNRSGRVLIAARDNQRAAPAYSINLVRTRLAAFAVSGGIAGMAGVLFAYEQHTVQAQTFSTFNSITLFLAVTIGGLTSVPFAVSGAVSLELFTLFGPRFYQKLGPTFISVVPLLITGPLLIINMYFYPGGSAEAGFKTRDRFLRWVAGRRDILVPSLIADRRVEQEEEERADVVAAAERHVEELESFDVITGPTVTCPVCGEVLSLENAAEHDHLRTAAVDDDAEPAPAGGGRGRLARARQGRR